MPVSKRTFLAGTAAIGLGGAAPTLAQAQAGGEVLGDLSDNEGLFVDLKEFKIHKGRAGGKAAQLAMVDAKEVSEGAVIVRSGGKLYIVDAKPAEATPQAMRDFWDTIPLPMR
jgi:hypothetical protein